MITILLKRIAAVLFSLAGIIAIGFMLTRLTPGDPVQRLLGVSNAGQTNHFRFDAQQYDCLYRSLNYDCPSFYITWSTEAVPDSFYFLPEKQRRHQLQRLSNETGNPELVYRLRKQMEELNNFSQSITEKKLSSDLLHRESIKDILILIANPEWSTINSALRNRYETISATAVELNHFHDGWKKWIPVIKFNTHNQFHFWLFGKNNSDGLIHGNLGNSTVTNRSVIETLSGPFKVTIIISLFAILLSVIIAIPSAIFLVLHRNNKLVKLSPEILLFIYSVPLFFLATLLLMLFANPDLFYWFPASGIAPAAGYPVNADFITRIFISAPYFVLPLLSYTVGTTMFFIRLLQSSLEEQLLTDHIQTARAKGASEIRIISIHALRNSFFPLLTSLSAALPAMISGSLLLENIFSIPGMGTEIVRAVQNQDYPVMIGFFLLIGIVTILIYTLTDLFYSLADPRVRKQKMKENYA